MQRAVISSATRSDLNMVHQRSIPGGRTSAHFGERGPIEDVRDGVARFDHDEADRAGFQIAAIVAGSERSDRGARYGGERAVERAHDRSDPYLMGRARQRVSAALALLG